MSNTCPTCKTKLSKQAPKGYCPECAASQIGPPVPLNHDLFITSDESIRKCFKPAAVVTDDIGIDVLLVTYEELAAIAAERPEINAAMQSLSYRITWKGIPVIAVNADAIEAHAKAQVREGYRVARLQPGLGLKPDDPKWETLAKQEPEKKPRWQRHYRHGKWHFYSDVTKDDIHADCGESLTGSPEWMSATPDRPPDADICPYCWAITSGTPGCTQISTTEIP